MGMQQERGDVTVRVENLSKTYFRFSRRRERLAAFLGFGGSVGSQLALSEVSFEAYAGEALGIIGENGSGKSTLLRIVAGISAADSGEVFVKRPVTGLLELGLGFHPDFSGRENAVLYGSLLGIPREEMEERLAAILEFADLGDFVDQPLRTYSSGMAARLAFAVATQVEPAVLVVDEALAVGDEAFQRKCIARMQQFKEQGRTVLFCSHAMYQVVGFCNRAIWLHQGKVRACGETAEVVNVYQQFVQASHRAEPGFPRLGHVPEGSPEVLSVQVKPEGDLAVDGELEIWARFRRPEPGFPVHLAVEIRDLAGITVATFATLWDGVGPLTGGREEEVRLVIPHSPFSRGPLDVFVHLTDEHALRVFHTYHCPQVLRIATRRWQPGYVEPTHRWELET